VAGPTISGQVRQLEEAMGDKLFRKVGRNLELTEFGQLVFRYADEIFGLGTQLMNTVSGRPTGAPSKLLVGVSDVVPKLISHRLLAAALELDPPVQLICREDKTERLLAELSIRSFDLVLSDEPLAGYVRLKAFNHLLGECGVSFMGASELAQRYTDGFPSSLDGAPMCLPTENTLMRRSLEHFFDAHGLRPRVVAEFEDSALLKVFARHGAGVFAGPTAIEGEVCAEYDVEVIGRTDEVIERFYAITVERRIKNPAVAAIAEAAQDRLFSAVP